MAAVRRNNPRMAKPKISRPDIGARLAECMAASADLKTQVALEKRSKVPQSTIGRLLRGETNPSIEVLQSLAVALGTTVEYLSMGRGTGKAIPVSSASHAGIPDPDILADAMGFLDELDGVLGRPPSPRPDPVRLSIAYAVVAEGEVVDGRSVVVRLADRLRDVERKRGNESGQAAGTGAADGGAHGRGAARKAAAAAGR
jgi:transcriptional regulator with XRE-family HTH domain